MDEGRKQDTVVAGMQLTGVAAVISERGTVSRGYSQDAWKSGRFVKTDAQTGPALCR